MSRVWDSHPSQPVDSWSATLVASRGKTRSPPEASSPIPLWGRVDTHTGERRTSSPGGNCTHTVPVLNRFSLLLEYRAMALRDGIAPSSWGSQPHVLTICTTRSTTCELQVSHLSVCLFRAAHISLCQTRNSTDTGARTRTFGLLRTVPLLDWGMSATVEAPGLAPGRPAGVRFTGGWYRYSPTLPLHHIQMSKNYVPHQRAPGF